jgi:tetratricopeptide (TPR) repeat protein
MRFLWPIIGLTLGLAGCVSPRDDRVQDYNADGVWLFQQGQYARAGETFQAALALKPNDAGLQYNLGECYRRQGAFAQAEQYYKECLQREPNHAPCRFALASLMVQTGRAAEAARLAQDWVAREPQSADAYALLGWYAHHTGDLPQAQARLHQALELEPHNRRALVEMALLYEGMERPERAAALYQRILEDDPEQQAIKERHDALLTKGVKPPRPD